MKIGVVGTGRIAGRFVDTVSKMKGISVGCIYNPNMESAEKFAKQYEIEVYTNDKNVFLDYIDAVYIASPHETHFEYSQFFLKNGKHVLCEKPATLSKSESLKIYSLAKARNLVFMEGLKTAYCPGFKALLEVAESGRIGRIADVEAAFSRLTPINTREYKNEIYNGSFLEFASYVLLPVIKLLGTDYDDVTFCSKRAQNGADAYTKAFFNYSGERMAAVKTGLAVKTEGQLLISGTNGYILAKSPWWLTKEFDVRYEDAGKIEHYSYEYAGSGLQYEIEEFINHVNALKIISDKEDDADRYSDYRHVGCEDVYTGDASVRMEDVSVCIAGVIEKFMDWNAKASLGQKSKFISKQIESKKRLPGIWAHRGCCTLYPENTVESFKAAAELRGIKGIELDIQLSKDGEIVVVHDENTKRVTGVSCAIKDSTLEELQRLEFLGDTKENGRKCHIPTLLEVLTAMKPYCEKNDLLINIELKTGVVRYQGIEEKACELVEKMNMQKYIVWSSFLPESVAMIKNIAKEAKTAILAVSLEECIALAGKTGADALHPYIGGMAYELPDYCAGMPVRAWNADEPFYKDGRPLKEDNLTEYCAWGATDIFTNIPQNYLDK